MCIRDRDDGDKEESDSISNQKELIREYLRSKSEIQIASVHVDDGYSGVDFNRPAFLEMMEEIKAGKVKDVYKRQLLLGRYNETCQREAYAYSGTLSSNY